MIALSIFKSWVLKGSKSFSILTFGVLVVVVVDSFIINKSQTLKSLSENFNKIDTRVKRVITLTMK